jgi:hypothetical protein
MEFIRRREDLAGNATRRRVERIVTPPPENPQGIEEYKKVEQEHPGYHPSKANPLRPLSVSEMKEPKVRELLKQLVEDKETGQKKADTEKKKKNFKFPRIWKSMAAKSSKKRDTVMIMYLNIKGEIEQPLVVPIYSGNMVIIRNKIHEVDPRAMWNFKVGMKTHKVLIVKEIDRRPVSNLDIDEIKRRGDGTDSDEFLIKAALRAQTITSKPINKWVWIIVGIAVVALLIFFFMQKGGSPTGTVTP